MAADLVLMDDGLTVEFGNSDECSDLTAQEAEAVTGRIRRWVNDFPVADVVLAFRGRVWIALAYASWAEWCECELGGLKLPAPKRREVVAELAGEGMSNVAIGSALNVDEGTVRNDRRSAGSENSEAERKRRGQDGKDYSSPHPKPTAPPPEIVVDAEIVCRDCYGNGCETCFPEEGVASPESDQAQSMVAEKGKQRAKPLPDVAMILGLEMAKIARRIGSLGADDRLVRNKERVANQVRPHLVELIEVCQDLANKLNI